MATATAVVEDKEEENVDKELTEYGVEEQGMTLEEKKSLLLVFKNSESTALADEHRRVGLGLQDTSNSTSNQIVGDPKNNTSGVEISEVSALEGVSHEETSCESLPEHFSIVDNAANNCNDSQSPKQKGVTYSTPKFTPKTSRLSLKTRIVDDEEENVKCVLPKNNSPKCKSPQFEDLFEDNTKAKLHDIDEPICFKNDLRLSINKKEDRKRNIDVFNAVKDCNEQPLMVNKQFKIVGKTPYYAVPHGMDIKDFTVYFKEQLAAIATNLFASQSKSLKLVPWGDPVIVSNLENSNANNTFEEIIGPADTDTVNPIAQNQRYNFRGRSSKRKCQDDIFNFKLSDEESSEDDIIFRKKVSTSRPKISARTKSPTYSASIAKRKSIFGATGEHLGEKEFDVTIDKTFISSKDKLNDGDTGKDSVSEDETKTKNKSGSARIKNICKSGIIRTKEEGEHSSQSSWEPRVVYDDDDDEDYEVGGENNTHKRKIPKPNTRKLPVKNKKNVSKPSSLEHIDSQEEGKNGVSKHPTVWLNTMCFEEQEDVSVIKPLPINPKMRKLKRPNSVLGGTKKKVTKHTSQEVDAIILPGDIEESDIPVQMDKCTACPICKEMFNVNDIQDHAAYCNTYEDADDVAESDVQTTSRCPICVDSFPTGPIFEKHAKCCQVKKRLVQPPGVGPTARNKSKSTTPIGATSVDIFYAFMNQGW